MTDGWIKLHRKMIDWEWFGNPTTLSLFIHILFMANWEDKKWQGILIKRGQFITSVANLSQTSGLSTQQVRTSLGNLILTGEITKSATNRFTVITVNKYDDYQQLPTNQSTNEQQTNNKQITTTKEIKNIKNINNINNKSQKKHLPKMEDLETIDIEKICNTYHVTAAFVASKWDDVMNYCYGNDKKYSDFSAVLRNFVKTAAIKLAQEAHGKSNIAFIKTE